jgi:hypothetical protein
MYEPKPMDTSRIDLPPEIVDLTEMLAENAHEVWAAQRIAQGWTYGSERDDAAKKHPDLVSYQELPDSEQEYARQAALQTLKVILALGYRVSRA